MSSYTEHQTISSGFVEFSSADSFTDIVYDNFGGAIYMSGSTVSIAGSTFYHNTGSRGGAIYDSAALLIIDGAIFDRNYVSGERGGALVLDAAPVTISNTLFTGNSAHYGGAIEMCGVTGNLTITGSTFSGNESVTYGGAVDSLLLNDKTAYLKISDTDFTGNLAHNNFHGGAVYAKSLLNLTVTGGTFAGNTATDAGNGGAIGNEGYAELNEVTFIGNSAYCGGAFWNNGTAVVSGGTFADGITRAGGGLIYNTADGNLTVNGGTAGILFRGSQAVAGYYPKGLMIYNAGTASFSGTAAAPVLFDFTGMSGENFIYNTGTLTLAGTTFSGAYGDSITGLLTNAAGTSDITGSLIAGNRVKSAAVWNTGGTITISGSTVSGNTGVDYAMLRNDAEKLEVKDSLFTGNYGNVYGGAIWQNSTGTTAVTGGTISSNTSHYGGAIRVSSGSAQFNEVLAAGNAANSDGGAINIAAGASMSVSGGTYRGNTAAGTGGHLYNAGSFTADGGTAGLRFIGGAANGGGAMINNIGTASFSGTAAAPVLFDFTGVSGEKFILNTGVMYFSGTTFTGASGSGITGVLGLDGGTFTAVDSLVHGNSVRSGVIWTSGGTSTFTRTVISANSGTDYAAVRNSGGIINLNDSLITGNNSAVLGGVIWQQSADGVTQVSGSTFSGNHSKFGGAAYVSGGQLTVKDSLFTGNIADNTGGAIHVETAGTVVISGSTFTGNIGYDGGNAICNAGTVTVSGSTFNTSATILNNGALTFTGSNVIGASLSGTGSCSIADASLNFANTDAIAVAGLTGTAAEVVFSNKAAVTLGKVCSAKYDFNSGVAAVFSEAQDFSGAVLSVTNTGLNSQMVSYALASGSFTFADKQTISVNGVACGINDDQSYQIGDASYKLTYTDGLLQLEGYLEKRSAVAFSQNWTSQADLPADPVVIGGETVTLKWGDNAVQTMAEALERVTADGKIALVGGNFGSGFCHSNGHDLYLLGGQLSDKNVGAYTYENTTVPAGILLTEIDGLQAGFDVQVNGHNVSETSIIAGTSSLKVADSTFGACLSMGGGTVTGDQLIDIRNTDVRNFYVAGFASRIDGNVECSISGGSFGNILLNLNTNNCSYQSISVAVDGSTVEGISLGNRGNTVIHGDSTLTLSGATILDLVSLSRDSKYGETVIEGNRTLNIGGTATTCIGSSILGVDFLNVASNAELVLFNEEGVHGGVISGGTASAVKVVNDGLITITGSFKDGTFVVCDGTEDSKWGNLQVDGTGYLHTGNNKLYYYNILYVDSTITGKSTGDEVMITVGDKEQLALYGVNAFTSSTEAKKAGVAGPLVIAKEDFAGNFYGNGTTLFANGSVALTTYGGKLIKGDDANAGDSSLTIAGGTFASMVVGGNRVSVDSGDVAVTAGTASLMVTGGEFNADKSYLAAAGYLINKGTSAALTVSEANLTLAGDDVVLKKYAFGGAFADNGTANITSVNVNVSAGKYESVFAGGWAQNNGTVKVTGATVNISGGSIRNLYAGGTDNGDGNAATVGTANITISGGSVRNVFLNGKYSRDTVTTATLNVTGECAINWIEGLCHSMAASTASTKTAVNIGADLTVEDILHVDEWNLTKVDTLLDFGTHTADLNGTEGAAVDTVIDFQIGGQSIGTEGWTAIAAKEFEGLGVSSIKINSTLASYDSTQSTWTSGAYTVTLNNSYDDTRKALIVTKTA